MSSSTSSSRKKIVALLSLMLALLMSIPLTMNILLYSSPLVYENTFYGALKNKISLIKDESKKRIILIGGSSVPFSLDSNYLKQYLSDYNPVDFGLYASLGTSLMLDLSSSYIREGDIVIVTPEISYQTLSNYYNGEATLKAMEGNYSMLTNLSMKGKESVIGATPKFNSEKYSYIIKNTKPEPDDIYKASSFNEYGDISVYRKGNIMYKGYDSIHMIDLDTSLIEDDFISRLNRFNDTCKSKKATCYYRFAPMNDAGLLNKDKIEDFYNYLNDKLDFEIIGNPYESILEKEWFYDTNYHLNSSGVIKWTKALIKDIKLTLDDSSKTDIVDPVKPPLDDESSSKEGDNTCLGDFNYLEKDDEVIITSLNESGLLKDSLVIPYKYHDKVITSFIRSVFQNNKTIKEITIQDNIRIIDDYSFARSNINKVIIDNDKPNSIIIGDHLLDEVDAYIYINKDNIDTYISNYNWAKYSSKIKVI